MKISNYIDTINFSIELVNVNQMLTNAQGNISFLGRREVKIAGYAGSVSLDELARKVLCAAGDRSNSDDLTTQERVAGIKIMYKLRNFYKITDSKINNKNFFTKLLNIIREFTLNVYTPRFYTEENGLMESYFRGYSQSRFIQEFGRVQRREFGGYENSDGSFGPPLRIMAYESAIRAKLAPAKKLSLTEMTLSP